jgi:hypothetical protein
MSESFVTFLPTEAPKPNSTVIVALDHITLRWEDEDINPKLAFGARRLGVVMNERAGRDLPEINNAVSDMMMYGVGCYKVGAEKTQHIPFHEFSRLSQG